MSLDIIFFQKQKGDELLMGLCQETKGENIETLTPSVQSWHNMDIKNTPIAGCEGNRLFKKKKKERIKHLTCSFQYQV